MSNHGGMNSSLEHVERLSAEIFDDEAKALFRFERHISVIYYFGLLGYKRTLHPESRTKDASLSRNEQHCGLCGCNEPFNLNSYLSRPRVESVRESVRYISYLVFQRPVAKIQHLLKRYGGLRKRQTPWVNTCFGFQNFKISLMESMYRY